MEIAVSVAAEPSVGMSRCVAVGDSRSDLPLFAEHGPEPERDMGTDEGPPLGDDNVIDILRARF